MVKRDEQCRSLDYDERDNLSYTAWLGEADEQGFQSDWNDVECEWEYDW
jgi:hypothetical protein